MELIFLLNNAIGKMQGCYCIKHGQTFCTHGSTNTSSASANRQLACTANALQGDPVSTIPDGISGLLCKL